ncbi:MAG: hypothetical protein ACRDRU_01005 [Pseudonocardiaceae bacterium]
MLAFVWLVTNPQLFTEPESTEPGPHATVLPGLDPVLVAARKAAAAIWGTWSADDNVTYRSSGFG